MTTKQKFDWDHKSDEELAWMAEQATELSMPSVVKIVTAELARRCGLSEAVLLASW